MRKAFVVDFDGTITREDVGFSIIKELAEDGWEEIGQLWIDKKIGTAECGRKQWNLIKHDDKEIREFVRNFELNPGFKEFIEEVKVRGYKLIITSDGYDIYIEEILNKNGFSDVELLCNSAIYDKGWNLSFLNNEEDCIFCGNCKKKVVEALKKKEYEVIYVGDGYSDRCACINSDAIFAKSHLKEYCLEQGIPHNDFDTFYDILKYIKTIH